MEMISLGMWIAKLFGKTPVAATARKIGLGVAIIGGVLLAGLLIWGGIRLHDAGVVSQYQDQRDAAVSNASRVADAEAAHNDSIRANVAEAENQNLADALANATVADPQHGKTVVGPVTDSYYDQLRKQKGN